MNPGRMTHHKDFKGFSQLGFLSQFYINFKYLYHLFKGISSRFTFWRHLQKMENEQYKKKQHERLQALQKPYKPKSI